MSQSSLHITEITPDEYKDGGKSLTINYSTAHTQFGEVLIASTTKGITYLSFIDDKSLATESFKATFPNATYIQKEDPFQKEALLVLRKGTTPSDTIRLHVKGTPFQIKVWKSLLTIPKGETISYKTLAERIDNTKAFRAVGTALGKNTIAFLIPCHRVVQSNGSFGDYRWGNTRKKALLEWEKSNKQN